MNDYNEYNNEAIQSIDGIITDNDIIVTIDIDFVYPVECSTNKSNNIDNTSDESADNAKSKDESQLDIYLNNFKYAVPQMFKDRTDMFYFDYEHDSTKKYSHKIKSSNPTQEKPSRYIVLYAKNKYGFIANSWIVVLRTSNHTNNDDSESLKAYLDDYDRFGNELMIDKETFLQMQKCQREIIVRCGARLQSNVSVDIVPYIGDDNKKKRCKNVDDALKFIKDFVKVLYEEMMKNISTFFYKGYKVVGDEFSCSITDIYDEEIESDITMDEAKSIIDRLTEGKSVSPIYCSIYTYKNFSKADLFRFADVVIDEVNKYVIEDEYYIEWRDIHFEDDFEFIVMNVIDSDNVSYNADIIIDIDKFIDNYNYRCRCINLLVDQITEAYSGEEY